jgi:hypothetical protein
MAVSPNGPPVMGGDGVEDARAGLPALVRKLKKR